MRHIYDHLGWPAFRRDAALLAEPLGNLRYRRGRLIGQMEGLGLALRVERNAYYETLEAAQKGDLDLTPRLLWFLRVLDRALDDAELRVAGCSQDTALRDIARLSGIGLLRRGDGGGRSTGYALVDP